MSNFEVKIYAGDLIKKLQGSKSRIPSVIELMIDVLHANAEKEAIEGCPVSHGFLPEWDGKNVSVRKRRSGMLRLSLKRGGVDNYYRRDKARHVVEFGSNLKYAPSIIENTDPYQIRPKRKKFLWFALGPTPADVVYTKKVTHPGGRKVTGKGGNALLPRVAQEVERTAPGILETIIRKVDMFS